MAGSVCVSMIGWPAISMVVVRAAPEFAAKLTETTPVPVAPAPALANESATETWYEHPACVTTRIGRLLAPAPVEGDEGFTS